MRTLGSNRMTLGCGLCVFDELAPLEYLHTPAARGMQWLLLPINLRGDESELW
jgi:hypothetical protein